MVGIGTITPATRLHVRDDDTWARTPIEGSSAGMLVLGDYNDGTNVKYFNLSSDGEKFVIGTMSDGLGSFTHRFDILRNGNVGLGTSSPQEKLNAPGKIYVSSMDPTTGGSTVRWYNNRLCYYSSSEKYKDDIQSLEEDFDRILKAEPKSFVDKLSGLRNIGYIAEEFDQLGLNHLVTYRDGEPDAVKYELVSVCLLELVKELKEKNQELERRIGELEAKE